MPARVRRPAARQRARGEISGSARESTRATPATMGRRRRAHAHQHRGRRRPASERGHGERWRQPSAARWTEASATPRCAHGEPRCLTPMAKPRSRAGEALEDGLAGVGSPPPSPARREEHAEHERQPLRARRHRDQTREALTGGEREAGARRSVSQPAGRDITTPPRRYAGRREPGLRQGELEILQSSGASGATASTDIGPARGDRDEGEETPAPRSPRSRWVISTS